MSDDVGPHVLKVDRRFFLRGAGGALLALPTLPSLLSASEARAQAASTPKCFVHFRSPHGGVTAANMYPASTALTETMTYNHQVSRGVLAGPVSNGNAVISPVLTAPSGQLTAALIAKMNVLQGLDIAYDIQHNFGACCGYYGKDQQAAQYPRASIDQLIAYSPVVYPSAATVKRRSVEIGSRFAQSGWYGFRTPGLRTSGVGGQLGMDQSSSDMYDSLLAGTQSSGSTPRTPIVDRVLDSYQRLRNGTRRLSLEDKDRLDQHITLVSELQRRLGTTLQAGCVVPTKPSTDSDTLAGNLDTKPMDGDPVKNVQFFQLINSVIAVAMNCGATRVANYQVNEDFMGCTFTTRAAQGQDWHLNVAHNSAQQALVLQSNQVFFSGVFVDMISRLNSFSDGMGGTLLDHSLVAWGQENGVKLHEGLSMPVVMAGSAGGSVRTGSYCDYRNQSSSNKTGLLYNQWMTNVLQAMGVAQADWVESTTYGVSASMAHPGYGVRDPNLSAPTISASDYPDPMWQKTAEQLPWL
jgi:hypothetical protein